MPGAGPPGSGWTAGTPGGGSDGAALTTPTPLVSVDAGGDCRRGDYALSPFACASQTVTTPTSTVSSHWLARAESFSSFE